MATRNGGKAPQPAIRSAEALSMDGPSVEGLSAKDLSAKDLSTKARRGRKPSRPKTVTVPWVRGAADRHRRGKGKPLVMVTAYDYPQARAADAAGVDLVLVGDSLAMVVLGHKDTLSVTMDEMLHHTKAVRRGLERALLVADMPYGSFHLGAEQAAANALRFVKESGAQAVKIEGARPDVIEALAGAEIPVMAHLGLTPQSLHRFGGFKVQGRGDGPRRALLEAARAVEESGAFALVLECIPADLAAEVSAELSIPTIGIGAGAGCGGQVLVYHDLLGMEDRIAPRFVRRYAQLGQTAREALGAYADDVREGRFPAAEETFAGGSSKAGSPKPTTPSPAQTETLEALYG
ncbi:MAG: 3-methyl-2-oxobutanoate hydroxymethyltransferase [Acidobacteriota bacterium]